MFYGCTVLTGVTIPDGVNSIGYSTFCGCTGLTSIAIPERVTAIGDEAFKNCTGITDVVVSDSVTEIGYRAFEGCSSLTSITLPFVGATKDGSKNTHFGYIRRISLRRKSNLCTVRSTDPDNHRRNKHS